MSHDKEKKEKNSQDENLDASETSFVQDDMKLAQELAEYKDKYLRLYAEFENTRKRMEREKLEFIRYANQELIVEFLNILDDLERSIEAAKAKHEDYTAFLKGIEMVMAHIYDLLKKNDVRPIESKGKMFDPHCHEALMQEQSDELEEGMIIDEFQKGYMLGDRVIRTNKVKVAKRNELAQETPADSNDQELSNQE